MNRPNDKISAPDRGSSQPATRTQLGLWPLCALAILSSVVTMAGGLERESGADATGDDRVHASAVQTVGGTWRSVANGDRVSDVITTGDVVWAATDGGGLIRWDGDGTFEQFLAPQDGLPSNEIRDIAEDGRGDLWLATSAGLARFDPETRAVDTWTMASSDGMPSDRVTAILPEDDGLWVGFEQSWDPDADHPLAERGAPAGAFTGGGLARFVPDTGGWMDLIRAELQPVPPGSSDTELRFRGIPSDNVTAIARGTDGTLWVGTRPYYLWDSEACNQPSCLGDPSFWLFAGGGLSGRRDGTWRRWRPTFDTDTGCYDGHITALASGTDGRMWVGTAGHGVLLMDGFSQSIGCATGQAYYVRSRDPGQPGLAGNVIRDVDVTDDGRVWIANGRGLDDGFGISLLDPNGTYGDSSASPTPWERDDEWHRLDVSGQTPGRDVIVSALHLTGPRSAVLGTIDERRGDGHGIRHVTVTEQMTPTWRAHRTADAGLPSNQITGIAQHADGSTWFSTKHRGVAKREASGAWRHWRAYAAATTGITTAAPAPRGFERIPVALEDRGAFEAAFPEPERLVRVEGGSTIYWIDGFIPPRGDLTAFQAVSPPIADDIATGTPIERLRRGPPGNRSSQIALRGDRAWVGAFRDRYQPSGRDGTCQPLEDCWLEGGVGTWDPVAERWHTFMPHDSPLSQFAVAAVEVDLQGRIWMGISDLIATGDGIAVYDPDDDSWRRHTISVDMPAGNGVTDFSVDPTTGDVWSAHFPVERRIERPGQPPEIVQAGGGVSRFDGQGWRSWTARDRGSRMRIAGDWGVVYAVLADRARDRIWIGGWDGSLKSVHWPSGRGADAVVNWCPLDECEPGDWEHRVWNEEGLVAALEIDARGHVWAATHRFGNGIVPATGGVKHFDGETWRSLTPSNSGIPSNQITALEPADAGMWVGTWADGASLFQPMPDAGPTPTPPPSPEATSTAASTTPSPSPSPSPSTSPVATPSAGATDGPSSTPSATGTAPTSTPTHAPSVTSTAVPSPTLDPTERTACDDARPCRALLPLLQRGR